VHIIDQYAYTNRIRAVDPLQKAGLAGLVILLCLVLDRPMVGLLALSTEARRRHSADNMQQFKEVFGAQLLEGLAEAERANLLHLLRHIRENVSARG
jgi:hypothetical protein